MSPFKKSDDENSSPERFKLSRKVNRHLPQPSRLSGAQKPQQQPLTNQLTKRRRKIPIPRFDLEIEQLEREFFAESSSDDDKKQRNTALQRGKNSAEVEMSTKPAIDLTLSSDDDDILNYPGWKSNPFRNKATSKENVDQLAEKSDNNMTTSSTVRSVQASVLEMQPSKPTTNLTSTRTSVLLEVTLGFLQTADLATTTIKNVVSQVEEQLGRLLNKDERKVVRDYIHMWSRTAAVGETESSAAVVTAVPEPEPANAPEADRQIRSDRVVAKAVQQDSRETSLPSPQVAGCASEVETNVNDATRRTTRAKEAKHVFQSEAANQLTWKAPPQKKFVEPSDSAGAPPPQRRRKRKIETVAAGEAKPERQQPARRIRARCQLCCDCPCAIHQDSNGAAFPLAQSDAGNERNLIRQLQKLEKACEHYEIQTDLIRRKLKQHRRKMWRERGEIEPSFAAAKEGSRFLPDVEELDQLDSKLKNTKKSVSAVIKAKSTVFGVGQQTTLTQMLGYHRANKAGDSSEVERAMLDDEEGSLIWPGPADADGDEDHESSGESVDDDIQDATVAAGIPADVRRVELRDGMELDEPSRIWFAGIRGLSSHRYPWDRLFENAAGAHDVDLDQLQNLLNDLPLSASEPADMSMLSQRGRDIVEQLTSTIESDPLKLQVLESACPLWRENIIFALKQKEVENLDDALANVKESRARLQHLRSTYTDALDRESTALEMFESTLQSAVSRFDKADLESAPTRTAQNGFFLSRSDAHEHDKEVGDVDTHESESSSLTESTILAKCGSEAKFCIETASPSPSAGVI